MITIENTEVMGWEHVIRGMRNPMNSWIRSDSYICERENNEWRLGEADFKLMKALANGGPTHAKYRRMITVYCDILAPLYWWKEFDTYKVGTVANSCSTMHKIAAKEFDFDDFSTENLGVYISAEKNNGDEVYQNLWLETMASVIDALNVARNHYIREKDPELKKAYWWQMIQLLPSSYNQRRTIMMNYEVLAGIYPMRKDHKLNEWLIFCEWVKSLPYSKIITLDA